MWITPGLIDAHVHFSQTGWADGRPDALDVRATHPYEQTEAELKAHPERYGALLPLLRRDRRFRRRRLCRGRCGCTTASSTTRSRRTSSAAGPLLSTLDHWLNLPAERQFIHLNDEASARDGVRYLASQGAHAVKVWYIVRPPICRSRSRPPRVAAAGDEARKHNLPLIVHATGLAEAKAALRAGANVLVHSVDDQPVDDEFLDLAKKNGTILIPTLTVLARLRADVPVGRRAQAAGRIDDPNGCVDKSTLAQVAETATASTTLDTPNGLTRARPAHGARRSRSRAQNLKTLVAAGIPIATGTDAGNPLTLHGPAIYAEMEAMQAAGMTPMQVIVSSTADRRARHGPRRASGTIEKGKDADLVILAADPIADVANFRKVRYVVRGGVVRSIDELRALAQK